jgi:hypothetical protein
MFTRHISAKLAAYVDGELAEPDTRRAERHLGQCVRCHAECEQVKLGIAALENLPPVEAPAAIWTAIESALHQDRKTVPSWRLAFVLVILLLLAGTLYWHRTAGWIETDSHSSATIKIGEIGSVEVAPNTRVRVVTERPDEHRLALARGEIRAKITAPPRLFFVDTASGVAVDLGCEYTLQTDEDGAGLLSVTKGWVLFQWKGHESLVPAGASCRTIPRLGPGVPYFDDAPESLKQDGPLDAILADARARDTLTLWHLLSRVAPRDRGRVVDRIAALTSPRRSFARKGARARPRCAK